MYGQGRGKRSGRVGQGRHQILQTRIKSLPPLSCTPTARPADGVKDLKTLADLQTSLAALAVSCGVRLVSFYLQSAEQPDGVTYDAQWWHGDSHASVGSVPTFKAGSQWIAQHYFMAMVKKLDALGVLESSVVFTSNDISNGRLHNNENQPIIVAAGKKVSAFNQRGVFVSYQRTGQEALRVPQTDDFSGILINQFFNTLLVSLGLAPADAASPGEKGFGSTGFASTGCKARYQDMLPGAGMGLPWVG